MGEHDRIVGQFETLRPYLYAVAYRMLGSRSDAEDAVQEAWLRFNGASGAIENLRTWLTTVTARICLNMLRKRSARRDEPTGAHVPDPIVTPYDTAGLEEETVLADSVGLALLVVLDTLGPAERIAFVLHDRFDVPFNEIGAMIGRTSAASRQLASRARRRVRGAVTRSDADLARQREVVDAFFAAARAGDFDALVTLLDPDVVARSDSGPDTATLVRGAAAVPGAAIGYNRPAATVLPALVNGLAGVVVVVGGRPAAVMAFTVRRGRIAAIDALSDRERVRRLVLPDLGSPAAGCLGGR